jgi:hypothetical protein
MSCRDRLGEERRFSAASRHVLMWKSGPSGPRHRRRKEEQSPVGTAEMRPFRNRSHRQHRCPP